jgi:hypothetical protein
MVSGHYIFELAKRDAGWKIARMKLVTFYQAEVSGQRSAEVLGRRARRERDLRFLVVEIELTAVRPADLLWTADADVPRCRNVVSRDLVTGSSFAGSDGAARRPC